MSEGFGSCRSSVNGSVKLKRILDCEQGYQSWAMIGGALCGKQVKGVLSMAMDFVEKFQRGVSGCVVELGRGGVSGLTHPGLNFSF